MSMQDALQERIDEAKDQVILAVRYELNGRQEPGMTLDQTLSRLDDLLAQQREERDGDAVDLILHRVGHVEGCDYTLKATASEMAVHAALFLKNGGPLEACGDVDWWPHYEIPPNMANVLDVLAESERRRQAIDHLLRWKGEALKWLDDEELRMIDRDLGVDPIPDPRCVHGATGPHATKPVGDGHCSGPGSYWGPES